MKTNATNITPENLIKDTCMLYKAITPQQLTVLINSNWRVLIPEFKDQKIFYTYLRPCKFFLGLLYWRGVRVA